MIERPKYLEYRHQRDRISSFTVKRLMEVKVERPASALARLVGKKVNAQKDSFQEDWTMELRTTDVMPDRSALVKTQVTSASRSAKGIALAYGDREDPTTEFLNEVVALNGMLSGHHGSLPTAHLVVFPEEPVKQGQEWQATRQDLLPISAPDGSIRCHEARPVNYSCRLDAFGEENGLEYADVSLTGVSEFGDSDVLRQSYMVSGQVRFAIRDGHTLTAEVVRAMATSLDKVVLTRTATEQFAFMSRGTEQTVGGMRI